MNEFVDMDVRRLWFSWIIAEFALGKQGGGYVVSFRKLQKASAEILADATLWHDVVNRAGFRGMWPWDAAVTPGRSYADAMSLFWSRLFDTIKDG